MQSEIFLNGKRYLSTKKATKIIELDEEHIKDLCREEKIDFTKVEGEYFVELEKLFEYKNKTNKPMILPVRALSTAVLAILLIGAGYFSGDILNQLNKTGEAVFSAVKNTKEITYKVGAEKRDLFKTQILDSNDNSPIKEIKDSKNVKTVDTYTQDFLDYLDGLKNKIVSGSSSLRGVYDEAIQKTDDMDLPAGEAGRFTSFAKTGVNNLALAVYETASPVEQFAIVWYKFVNNLFSNEADSLQPTADSVDEADSGQLTTNSTNEDEISRGLSSESEADRGEISENVPSVPATPKTTTIVTNPIREIIKEVVVERVIQTSGITLEDLQKLNNELRSEIYKLSSNTNTQITNTYQVISATNNIDNLGSVTITDSNISSSNVSGTELSFTNGTIQNLTVTGTATSTYGGPISATSGTYSGNLTVTGNTTLNTLTVSGDTIFDTDTLYIDSINNRVGIGSTTPSDTLSVNGATYLAPISAPSITTDRLYNISNDLYWGGNLLSGSAVGNWTSNGTDVWRASGNVGIGTTSPFRKLSVEGNAWISGDLTANSITATSSISAPYFTATSATATSTFAGGLAVGTNKFVVDYSTGNVGVGTESPGAKFDVNGDISLNKVNILQTHQVYAIGDSLTNYGSALADLLGALWNVNSKGVGGNTTTQMAARFSGDVVVDDAEYVIILGGINDIAANASAATIESNLQAMYTAANANGSKVVAVTITPFKTSTSWTEARQVVLEDVNNWILNMASDVDYRIDAYSALEDPTNPDTLLASYALADYLHLTPTGYIALANSIYIGTTWIKNETVRNLSISGGNVSLSQSLRTTDSPQFSGLVVNGLTSNINLATPVVGLGTINPQRTLDIRGSDLVLGSNDQYAGNMLVMSTDTNAINKGGSIGLGGVYSGSTGFWTFGSIKGAKENSTGGNAQGYLSFWTTSSSANTFERARINSSGYLGINTTAPASFLDINPVTTLTSSGVTGITLRDHLVTLSGSDPTTYDTIYGTKLGNMQLYSTTANQVVTEAASLVTAWPWKSTSANVSITNAYSILVPTKPVSTSQAVVTNAYGLLVNASTGAINNYAGVFLGGNVGIGTTSPFAKLSVVGDVVADYFNATSTTATSTFAGGFAVGTNKLVVDRSTGNVGIGTASPTAKLEVSNGFKVNSSGGVNVSMINGSASGWKSIALGESSSATGEGSIVVGSGIASGQYSSVFGKGGATAAGQYSVVLGGTAKASATKSITIGFGYSGSGGGSLNNNIANSVLIGTNDGVQDFISFFAGPSGYTGIGTMTPSAKLDIYQGNLNLDNTTNTNQYGVISKNGTSFIHNFNYGNNGTVTTTGQNTFVGEEAGNLTMGSTATSASHGSYNTATGYRALYANTLGYFNTANGVNALFTNNTGYGNTASGIFTLYLNTTGYRNTAYGGSSMYNNNTGYHNTAIGYSSLQSNTSGYHNTASGYESLFSNTSGRYNTASGYTSLYANSTGMYNTAVGYSSLYANSTGHYNIAFGYNAGRYIANGSTGNTTGDYNTFLGYNTKALADNDQNEIVIGYDATGVGSNSVVLGNDSITTTALKGNVGIGTTSPFRKLSVEGSAWISGDLTVNSLTATSSISATAFNSTDTTNGGYSIGGSKILFASSTSRSVSVGIGAGNALLSGALNNTALGYEALYLATTSSSNTAVGYQALKANTTGYYNTAVGAGALDVNTTGIYNTAVGGLSMGANTTGSYNMAAGFSLTNNTTGNYNSALGYDSLSLNTTGTYNTSIGSESLRSNRTGSSNVAIGTQANRYNGSATSTVAIGYQAGQGVSTVSYNQGGVIIGYRSGVNLTTGDNNILLGYQAGETLTTGDNNIVIGYNIDSPTATSNNTMTIGNLIFGTGIDGNGTTISTGNIGIGSTTPNYKLTVDGTVAFQSLANNGTGYYVCANAGTGELATSTTACGASSERFKTNINDLTYGLDTVLQLRPVSFNWKSDFINSSSTQIGFIAEEVDLLIPEVIGHDDKGTIMNLDYPKLTSVLVNAIKEIWNKTQELIAKVSGLENRLNELEARLNALEGVDNTNTANSQQPTAEPSNTTPPTITITGNNPAVVEINSNYIDLGATAVDYQGNSLIVDTIDADTVDTTTAGEYTVTYTAFDGTLTSTSTRIVLVEEAIVDSLDSVATTTEPVVDSQ